MKPDKPISLREPALSGHLFSLLQELTDDLEDGANRQQDLGGALEHFHPVDAALRHLPCSRNSTALHRRNLARPAAPAPEQAERHEGTTQRLANRPGPALNQHAMLQRCQGMAIDPLEQ